MNRILENALRNKMSKCSLKLDKNYRCLEILKKHTKC